MRRWGLSYVALAAMVVLVGCGSLSFLEPRPNVPEPDVARSFYDSSATVSGSLLMVGDWGSGSAPGTTPTARASNKR